MHGAQAGFGAGREPRVMSPEAVRSMLVSAGSLEGEDEARLSKARVFAVIGRRSLPSLIEATVVPAVLFYLCLVHIGPVVAMLAALAWSYGAVVRRLVMQTPVPGVLRLAVLGLTVRTLFGILSGTFVYFLQPVVTTVALAAVFLASLRFGRPMIGRMAEDFCPLAPEIARLPSIERLFTGLTALWAATHLFNASVTFALLMSVSTAHFVLLKTFVSLAITCTAIVLTVSLAIRTARAEDLVLARVRPR
jgi:intracellular septation protein A